MSLERLVPEDAAGLEHLVSYDLDVQHYYFKWKEAKEYVSSHHGELRELDYWLKVRQTYLELGGGYADRVRT